ncbi:lactonase family protein [Candidatus Latescibacterota bacterium]
MFSFARFFFLILALIISRNASADIMIAGYDEKMGFEDGTMITSAPGNDTVVIFDISNPRIPRITATLDLMNSLHGPPTNLIITSDEKIALIANPVDWVQKEGVWTNIPDNKLHIIDLEGRPKHLSTIKVGQQPSGMDLTPDNKILLIGNRAEPTVSVVRITGKSAELIDTIAVTAPVDAVSITPDGKRALFTMRTINTVGVLHINGGVVTFSEDENIPVGIQPYNVAVSPKGDIALVNNAGVTGGNDGNIDPVCVIDMTAAHPHIIDWVAVGDGPEGLAFSPSGDMAVSVLINGSQNAEGNPNTAWAANENGKVAILAIDGKKVSKVQEIEVGGMPEGVVFSPDGEYIYVGNFTTDDMTILRVGRAKVTDTGKRIKLQGSPASMR